MKRALWVGVAILAVAPLMGGCATNDSGPSLGNLGRNFADDWTGARAFDRASADWDQLQQRQLLKNSKPDSQAKEREELRPIREAGQALDQRIQGGSKGSLNIAQTWILARLGEAMSSELDAQNMDPSDDRDEALKESSLSYRAALAFLPSNASQWRSFDPQTLNALGYFLADRGRNHSDFALAEKLTKLSFDLMPERDSTDRYNRAQGPGDSHAWALFRLGRTADALKAQAAVVSTLGDDGSPDNPPPADVIYHWGAICRVAGRENAARDAFKYALTQKPSVELREILEANLSGSVV